jgi:hypothetical protein
VAGQTAPATVTVAGARAGKTAGAAGAGKGGK